jgi:transposase
MLGLVLPLTLAPMGHDAFMMAPAYTKPYVKRGKNDAVDAGAVCEAMSRPDMRFAPIKSADQQAVLMLHKTGICWSSSER